MSNTNKTKKTKAALYILLIILSSVTLIAIVVCAVLTKERLDEKAKQEAAVSLNAATEKTYTQAEVDTLIEEAYNRGQADKDEEYLEYIKADASTTGANYAGLLRKLFPDDMVYMTGNKFKFVPINTDLPLSALNPDNLVVCDNGEIKYTDGSSTISKMGIDVSEYQGEIDWTAVADFGVDFAILRAGYRGYVSGAMVEDSNVITNIEGATENGIEVGLYYFSQAVTEEEVKEEASVLINFANEYSISGPLVIDIEKIESDSARGNALTQEERTLLVNCFCEEIKNAGYTPMIYGNINSLFEMLDYNKIGTEAIWYASYTQNYYFPYAATVWQYSDSLTVPGIDGKVDADIWF